MEKQKAKEQRVLQIQSNFNFNCLERLEDKKHRKPMPKESRNHSASIPLFVKLEKEFEERFVIPELKEREKKLKEYREVKSRQQSFNELKEWEKLHKEMVKEKIKELSVKRNYKAQFPTEIHAPKTKWSNAIKEIDKIEREKHKIKPKPKFDFTPQRRK